MAEINTEIIANIDRSLNRKCILFPKHVFPCFLNTSTLGLKNKNAIMSLFSIPFTFDFDLKIPVSYKLLSKSRTVKKSDRLIVEMPIDACITPNHDDDKIVAEIYLNILHPIITKEQQEWAESLEVIEKILGFLMFEDQEMRVNFSQVIASKDYPPAFCVIKIPSSIKSVEANLMNKGSSLGVKDTSLSRIVITTDGGKCMFKNNQSDFIAVKTEGGDCSVEKTHALAVILSTGTGDCHISDSTANFSVNTTSGSVHVKGNNSMLMSVETENGDCHVTNNKSNVMAVNSKNGNLELRNNTSNYLDAVTKTGETICAGNEFLFGEGCKTTLKPTLHSQFSSYSKLELEPTLEHYELYKANTKPRKDEPKCPYI